MKLGSIQIAEPQRMEQNCSAADGEFVRAAVNQFERPLTGYVAHLLSGDVDRAREVVQEAFFRLCAEPRQRTEPHLREWLYAVCRNLAIDIRRKEKRMQFMDDTQVESYVDDKSEPVDAVERDDTYCHVLAAMQALSNNQQEVVRLKFQHGMSYKQISEVTNLTVTNVGFLLHTALKALRQRLGERANCKSG